MWSFQGARLGRRDGLACTPWPLVLGWVTGGPAEAAPASVPAGADGAAVPLILQSVRCVDASFWSLTHASIEQTHFFSSLSGVPGIPATVRWKMEMFLVGVIFLLRKL